MINYTKKESFRKTFFVVEDKNRNNTSRATKRYPLNKNPNINIFLNSTIDFYNLNKKPNKAHLEHLKTLNNDQDNSNKTRKTESSIEIPQKEQSIDIAKTIENEKKEFDRNENEIVFCICIEGSIHCEYAFDLITKEIMTPKSKLIMSYIFNSKHNHLFNYANKKETIEEIYSIKALRLNKISFFINEYSDTKNHFLHQVFENAVLYQSNYLVIGQNGLRGPRGDKQMFDKGVDFILKDTRFPIILIQEKCERNPKEKRNINWLFILDRNNNKCNKILKTFLPLVSPEIDYVKCINLLPAYLDFDDIEEEFRYQTKCFNIKNFNYEIMINTTESYAKKICEMVNFGNDSYDFVCFYHNQEKFIYNPDKCDSKYFIYKMKANLCFSN